MAELALLQEGGDEVPRKKGRRSTGYERKNLDGSWTVSGEKFIYDGGALVWEDVGWPNREIVGCRIHYGSRTLAWDFARPYSVMPGDTFKLVDLQVVF